MVVIVPERIALMGPGAFEYAVGSQAWNGTIPLLAAKPTKQNIKAANIIPGDKPPATDISMLQFRVPAPSMSSVRVKIRINR
jgi:hypothetical protein